VTSLYSWFKSNIATFGNDNKKPPPPQRAASGSPVYLENLLKTNIRSSRTSQKKECLKIPAGGTEVNEKAGFRPGSS
jgi:hypothetical protein